MADPSSDRPPPPVRQSARKPLTLISCGVIVAALLLVVVANLDNASAPPVGGAEADLEGITGPAPLTAEELESERQRGATGIDSAIGDIPAGGWIQISSETGQLAQQYRFERLDPDPEGKGPGWINMVAPEFEVYGSGGSALVLSGDTALAFAPESAIESGTLTGNVLIQRYEHVGPGPLDRSQREPTLVVRTDEAVFDNILGEVRCDGWIRLETTQAEFNGHELSVLLNDEQDIIQRLDVARVDSIRFARGESAGGGGAPAPSEPPRRPRAATPDPAPATPPTTDRALPSRSPSSQAPRSPSTARDRVQFYRLTLHENVRISQSDGASMRIATGDELSVILSSESEGLGDVLALVPRDPAAPDPAPPAGPRPRHLAELVLGAVLALADGPERTIAPPPTPGDTVITCDGGLTMEPVDRKAPLPSPRDARLDLVGTPVRLEDEAAETLATCALLRYHFRPGETELLGSDDHALTIASPQLDARGERFWLVQRENAAGFTGPGTAAFLEGRAGATRERLRIAWSERVDLAFAADGEQRLTRLERAAFTGSVHVVSAELQLDAVAGEPGEAPRGAEGEMRCRQLALDFRPAPAGDPAASPGGAANVEPAYLRATGDVSVAGTDRVLRAQALDVWFAEGADAAESDLERMVAETDVRLRLEGGERVFADRLDVDGRQRTAVLSGREVRLVDGPNVLDRVELITLDEGARRYTIAGKGRLRQFDEAIFGGEEIELGSAMFDLVEGRTEELRITWHEGVEFLGGAGDANGAELARFTGDVAVLSPELRLTHADELVVRFEDGAAEVTDPRRIESIDARGRVHARSAGDDGEIRAEHLHVDLRTTPDGSTIPLKMVAAGNVHVADEKQQVWAEVLTVTFREIPPDGEERAGDFTRARVGVDDLTAEGGVQVRLAAGERAFADRLLGSGARETAELLGDRVMVLAGQVVLDDCTHLILDKESARHRVEGPGVFYQVADPLPALAVDGPAARPEIDSPRTLEAVWTEAATYTESEGGGTLELRGSVHGESRPTPLEFSTIDADAVKLEFRDAPPVSGDEPTRQLARLVATGDARLENRTWQTPDNLGLPRIFHVAGDHVDYDQRTLEALVIGDGELLIRDEWTTEGKDRPGLGGGFGSRGTTLFRWNERLHMRQVVDDRFNIVMSGDVECLHRDLDGNASTVTGQVLEATVVRSGADDEAADARPRGGLRLGGSMEPKRLYGRGGIFVRTPQRDVTCDEFAYNLMTGMAEVNAAPGRMVFIHSRNATEPMRHQRVLWDMRNDTITIYRGGG